MYTLQKSCNLFENQALMAQEGGSEQSVADLKVKLYENKLQLLKAKKELKKRELELTETLALLKAQEMKIAEIISGDKDGARINEALLNDLIGQRDKSVQASRQFEDLVNYVTDSYKLIKADEAVEKEFKAKAALVREKIAVMLSAGNLQSRKSGMVLDINRKLGVVAIDLGYSDGVTQGSEWQVKEDDRKIASLKIVQVRRSLSLGVLVEGKLQDVLQGATVDKNIKIAK
ncbi:MAG: hypothetical protein MK132_13165 [Lentisphaerales bacterium]|nr:hypothetical protein [Lentisphaerales bacterium]